MPAGSRTATPTTMSEPGAHHQLLAHRGAARRRRSTVVVRSRAFDGELRHLPVGLADAGHEAEAIDDLAARSRRCCRCAGRRRSSAAAACRRRCAPACSCAGTRPGRSPASCGGRRDRSCRGCASRSWRRTTSCGPRPAARPTRRRPARRRRRCRRRSCRRRCRSGRRRCCCAAAEYSPRSSEAPWPGCVSMPNAIARRGVVEVAQVLDVEAVVAVRVELAGALEVGGHVVAAVRDGTPSSTSALRSSCCGRGCRCRRRWRGSASAAVAFQLGSAAFRLPGTEQSQALAAPRLVSVSPRSKQYSHCASALALPSAV